MTRRKNLRDSQVSALGGDAARRYSCVIPPRCLFRQAPPAYRYAVQALRSTSTTRMSAGGSISRCCKRTGRYVRGGPACRMIGYMIPRQLGLGYAPARKDSASGAYGSCSISLQFGRWADSVVINVALQPRHDGAAASVASRCTDPPGTRMELNVPRILGLTPTRIAGIDTGRDVLIVLYLPTCTRMFSVAHVSMTW